MKSIEGYIAQEVSPLMSSSADRAVMFAVPLKEDPPRASAAGIDANPPAAAEGQRNHWTVILPSELPIDARVLGKEVEQHYAEEGCVLYCAFGSRHQQDRELVLRPSSTSNGPVIRSAYPPSAPTYFHVGFVYFHGGFAYFHVRIVYFHVGFAYPAADSMHSAGDFR